MTDSAPLDAPDGTTNTRIQAEGTRSVTQGVGHTA